MSEPEAVFIHDGDCYVPTQAALGPWRQDALHGGAINALFARCLERDGFVVARMTIDILRRVPSEPLRVKLSEEEGSRRLRWQSAELWTKDFIVARAQALRIPEQDIPVPEDAIKAPVFQLDLSKLPDQIPERHKASIVKNIGYANFSSHAMSMSFAEGSYMKPGPATAWLRLVLPVVAGEPITPYQRLAAAADYSGAANAALPFNRWSFMNSDLTLSVTRRPVGEWMAVSSQVHSQRSGIGLGDALLHDMNGPLGRSTQTQLISMREAPQSAKTGTDAQ